VALYKFRIIIIIIIISVVLNDVHDADDADNSNLVSTRRSGTIFQQGGQGQKIMFYHVT